MEQFDQLLTCCVCLDRYRTPKLLPCQHSYCMEPCMEGLVDYVKRQVKCPECRAEHRVPYNGIQGFPTNYTLQKFLELHADITGELPDPNADAIMSRCNVCSEKAYVHPCAHCDKKVCNDCKEAHCDILKREISRVNNQVKRGLHRLEDCLKQVERNQGLLESNAGQVFVDIEEVQRRLSLAVKERCDFLKSTVDQYLSSEIKNLKDLRANLELELANIQSNSDLMEKHIADDTKWDDNELMDCKDIFIKMMDFIRNYDPGTDEYTRRIRFVGHDSTTNELARKVLELGEIKIHDSKPLGGSKADSSLTDDDMGPLRSSGLSRSKSDHRLVAEFRRRGGDDGGSPPTRRRFGESRYSREENKSRTNFGTRFAGGGEDDDDDLGNRGVGGRFRSRFLRPGDDDEDMINPRKSLHLEDGENHYSKVERVKVVDTEDASRGPLSGCIRLADSSRIIQRLKEMEMAQLRPKKKDKTPPVIPKFVPLKPNPELFAQGAKKSQPDNQGSSSTTTTPTTVTAATVSTPSTSQTSIGGRPQTAAPVPAPRPSAVAAPQAASRTQPASSNLRRTATQESEETESSSSSSSDEDEEEEDEAPAATNHETPAALPSRPPAQAPGAKEETAAEGDGEDESEYEYYDYDEDEEEVEVEEQQPDANNKKGATSIQTSSVPPALSTPASSSSYASQRTVSSSATSAPSGPPQPTSLASRSSTLDTKVKEPEVKPTPSAPQAAGGSSVRSYVGSRTTPNLLGSLAAGQDQGQSGGASYEAVGSGPSAPSRYRRGRDDSQSFVSKYLAQSKMEENGGGAQGQPSENQGQTPSSSSISALSTRKLSGESQYPSGRSRYAALKERRDKVVARSKSSALLGGSTSMGFSNGEDDEGSQGEDEDEEQYTPFTSRFGRELAKSRSSHLLKSGPYEDGPRNSSSALGRGDAGENLSSWARYLKQKYGGRTKNTDNSLKNQENRNVSSGNGDDLDNHRSSLILGGGLGTNGDSSIGGHPFLGKQSLHLTFGSRGSQSGLFTWPRGIAVGPDNSIVVADSSNHRVQIFNESGEHRLSFGCYGNGEGEFDCLAGVAVNRIGQYIIADRYNHRIQIFDPSGHFLRSFGSQGTGDGKFSYPWGITTDAMGFIYVCDKENHRVQVFQSDGTFVGKFGTAGSKAGQLEHPHYVAVSNTNKVVVSDSNNHRIQIFDVNGKVITSFGSEGTAEGQFKFPRGVAVDDQGCIFVADSGNNRIQIFNPDGTFLRGFGRWGHGEGEFKGLEGIAVNSAGNILVADRENHRVQVF